MRGALISLSNFTSYFMWPLLIIGLILEFIYFTTFSSVLIYIGIGIYGLNTLICLVTLPVELNARPSEISDLDYVMTFLQTIYSTSSDYMYLYDGTLAVLNQDLMINIEDDLVERFYTYTSRPAVSQSILETGYYRSEGCKKDNNLFGLYNWRKKEYYKFSHWTESVKAYRDMIQYRYKNDEDYYHFLDRIGYAEDSLYIQKIKSINYVR